MTATLGVSVLPLSSRLDRTIAWAILAATVVVATLLLTGAVLDDLAAGPVLALNAGLAGLGALLSFWFGKVRWPRSLPSISGLRPIVAELRADLWLAVLVAVGVGEVLWRLAIAYLMPPYAIDALWYHLTTVAGWLQADRIGPSDFSIWSTVYPYNGELLFTWPALLLGRDTLIDAVPLPLAILGAVAVAGIGRTAGLSRRGAAAAACLFLLAPIVLSQSTANYTDLIFISFFLCAFHFVLRFVSNLRAGGDGNLVYLLLAGLAGGLALGTKWLGLVYLAVLSLLLVAHVVAARLRRSMTPTEVVAALLVFVLPVLALGAYHYVEMWIRFGNPLYPVKVTAFGIDVFEGRPRDCFLSLPREDGAWWREIWGQWRRDFFFLGRPRFHAYSYDDRASGLGPLWSYLGIPLVPVFALRLFRTNRDVLLNLLLPIAAMFALQPYRWWSRFTIIVIVLGVVAIVAVVEALPRRWSSALKIVVLVLVAFGVAFPTLKIDGEFWAPRILAVARIPADERTIGRIDLPAYRWADRAPPGTAVGVDTAGAFPGGAPSVFAYPLFGIRFQHRVYSLPQSDEATFARVVAKRRISLVFVGRGRPIDRWAAHAYRAGCARRVYDGFLYPDDPVRVYRVFSGCDWLPLPRSGRSGARRSDTHANRASGGVNPLCLPGQTESE